MGCYYCYDTGYDDPERCEGVCIACEGGPAPKFAGWEHLLAMADAAEREVPRAEAVAAAAREEAA